MAYYGKLPTLDRIHSGLIRGDAIEGDAIEGDATACARVDKSV